MRMSAMDLLPVTKHQLIEKLILAGYALDLWILSDQTSVKCTVSCSPFWMPPMSLLVGLVIVSVCCEMREVMVSKPLIYSTSGIALGSLQSQGQVLNSANLREKLLGRWRWVDIRDETR